MGVLEQNFPTYVFFCFPLACVCGTFFKFLIFSWELLMDARFERANFTIGHITTEKRVAHFVHPPHAAPKMPYCIRRLPPEPYPSARVPNPGPPGEIWFELPD